jgi:hypothetical protein
VSAAALEAFLARLYVDDGARARFLADPLGEARRAGLDDAEAASLAAVDRADLAAAADSFAHKRAASSGRPTPPWWRWLARALRRG